MCVYFYMYLGINLPVVSPEETKLSSVEITYNQPFGPYGTKQE